MKLHNQPICKVSKAPVGFKGVNPCLGWHTTLALGPTHDNHLVFMRVASGHCSSVLRGSWFVRRWTSAEIPRRQDWGLGGSKCWVQWERWGKRPRAAWTSVWKVTLGRGFKEEEFRRRMRGLRGSVPSLKLLMCGHVSPPQSPAGPWPARQPFRLQ